MTVIEYLKVINGIFDDMPLDSKMIKIVGFVDVLPEPDVEVRYLGEAQINLSPEEIIVDRDFGAVTGDFHLKKATKLNDDISLHCGKCVSPEEVLSKSIRALEQIKEVVTIPEELAEFDKKIEALKQALSTYQDQPQDSGFSM